MTQEEIGRVVQIEQVDPALIRKGQKVASQARRETLAAQLGEPKPKNNPPRTPLSDQQLEETWQLATSIGQAAAARQFGISQAGLQSRMLRYQRRRGLTGPLPGTMTHEQIADAARERAKKPFPAPKPAVAAAVAAEEQREAQARAARLVAEKSSAGDHLTNEAENDASLASTNESSEDSVNAQTTVVLIQHPDGEVRARAFNDGYDHAVADSSPPKLIDALIEWLIENGPSWTPVQAAGWFSAFNAAVNLIYPSGYES
jgi:hypothetical protein